MSIQTRLFIKTLRIQVTTESGQAGRTMSFRTGLNILRADNTSGKSTALNSILYALGMEGMLGPTHKIPLKHAVTDEIEIRGRLESVIESEVRLEISNFEGETITITRAVVDPIKDNRLIQVAFGSDITEPSIAYTRQDFFVRLGGAAARESGFHFFLAHFLGLSIPNVRTNTGDEVPLYFEAHFPYYFVEQTHGWTGIQSRMPNHLRIREIGKRAAEFVLSLDALYEGIAFQAIKGEMSQLEVQWRQVLNNLQDVARSGRVRLTSPPKRITDVADDFGAPQVLVHEEWYSTESAIDVLTEELGLLRDNIPVVEENSEQVEEELRENERRLSEDLAVLASVNLEYEDLQIQKTQIERRVSALREDLQRHKDTRTLQRIGAQYANSLGDEHTCPTCHQFVTDAMEITQAPMTIDQSIDYIDQQVKTFEASAEDLERVMNSLAVRKDYLAQGISERRGLIRAAKESLTSPSSVPSVVEITRRIRLEDRIADLKDRNEELMGLGKDMIDLQARWNEKQSALKSLNPSELSPQDRSKLTKLQLHVREQLATYGFGSLSPTEIDINQTTIRPSYEGFDLGVNISASDMVRLIWAYLIGIFKLGTENGNHLGVLIFDEPRQQETAAESYASLIWHASEIAVGGRQIIFATSESSEHLGAMAEGTDANIISLASGEKLLLEGL